MALSTVARPRNHCLPVVRLAAELLLVSVGFVAYFGVRGLTEGSETLAERNAGLVIRLERALHVFWEPALQQLALRNNALVTVASWIYIWGHWPVIFAVGAWLWCRQPSTYSVVRNAFLICGAIGLVIFAAFPVAPPRLTDLSVVDTVTLHSHAYRVLQPPTFVNQYASVPSLHFGWDLLIGLALVQTAASRPLRVLGWMMPVLMALAVIVTANHYVLDILAGGVVALTGLFLARGLQVGPARLHALSHD